MSKSIYARSSVSAENARSIERHQFQPITPKQKQWHDMKQKLLDLLAAAEQLQCESITIDIIFNPLSLGNAGIRTNAESLASLDVFAIDKNGYQLTNRELYTLTGSKDKSKKLMVNLPNVMDHYVRMVCDYVNHLRNRGQPQRLSCATLPCVAIDELKDMTLSQRRIELKAKEMLESINCTPATFSNLDFLLVPYVNTSTDHSFLCGVAPRQRFVFVIDSVAESWTTSSTIVIALRDLIFSQMGNFAFAPPDQNASPSQGEWRLYGQWSFRSATHDGSPNSAQQTDDTNCGIFTSTNAFCLAAGYNLDCYVQDDLNTGKRPRMVAEFLNGGLMGDGFDYDLFEVPTITARERAASASATSRPGRSDSMLNRILRRNTGARYPLPDDRQQGGFVSEDEGTSAYADDSGSDGSSDDEDTLGFAKEPLYTPEQIDSINNLTPAIHAQNDPAEHEEDDDIPFPRQFQNKGFKQAVLVYGSESLEGATIQKRRYSKRELKGICRELGLEGWKRYSHESQAWFGRWVVSEIGAVLARLRGDKVGPVEWAAEGERSGKQGRKWKDEGNGETKEKTKRKRKSTDGWRVDEEKGTRKKGRQSDAVDREQERITERRSTADEEGLDERHERKKTKKTKKQKQKQVGEDVGMCGSQGVYSTSGSGAGEGDGDGDTGLTEQYSPSFRVEGEEECPVCGKTL